MIVYSPNMLKTFEKCSKMYFFKYVKNLSMPVNDEIFETGKNIHAMASYYLNRENIDRFEDALSEKENSLWQNLKNNEYFSYECLKTEYNLTVKIDEYYFGGRLDALVKSDNDYIILDYKTGSAPKDAVYDYQTMVYLLAVSELFSTCNVIFVYIDLKNKKNTEINLSESLKQEYKTILKTVADKISKENYSASKNNCKLCEYGKICYDKILD